MASEVTINVTGVVELNTALSRMVKQIRDDKKRRQIGQAGAPFVVAAAQNIVPVYDKPFHYRYSTTKLIGRIRAPKGKGVKVAEYVRGNLRNAIMDLSKRKTRYRKLPLAIVGPIYGTRKKEGIGSSYRNADGYYAHMIYGSAKAFRSMVMAKALSQAQGQALQAMLKEAGKIIDEAKRKNGLNG